MIFGTYLVRRGLISPEQFVEAVEAVERSRPALGELALRQGKMRMKDVFAVLAQQARHGGPFGKIAVELGILTESELAILLLRQQECGLSLRQTLIEMNAVSPQLLEEAQQQFHRSAKRRGADANHHEGTPRDEGDVNGTSARAVICSATLTAVD